jgi:hypothetical protein
MKLDWRNEGSTMFGIVTTLVVGGAFLPGALFSALSTRAFLQTSVVVPGKVVSLNAGGSHPQIAFVTRQGETVSYPQGGCIYGMTMGQNVSVRYAEARPRTGARIDAFGAIWSNTIALAAIGGIAVLTALKSPACAGQANSTIRTGREKRTMWIFRESQRSFNTGVTAGLGMNVLAVSGGRIVLNDPQQRLKLPKIALPEVALPKIVGRLFERGDPARSLAGHESTLERIRKARHWFEQREPSSPMSLLLLLAEHLVGKRYAEVANAIPTELMLQWESKE